MDTKRDVRMQVLRQMEVVHGIHEGSIQSLNDEDDLFSGEYALNSITAMSLLMQLEEDFGILIDDSDYKLDNFRSVDALTMMVLRYTDGGRIAAKGVPTGVR